MSGLILQFAFNYTDNNRQTLSRYTTMESLAAYLKKQNIVEQFAEWADKNGLKRRNLMIQKSHHLLQRFLLSRIVYNILDEEALCKYINLDDPALKAAQKAFNDGNHAFPQMPKEKEKK